jgi:nucleoside-diphosphate-sugar epimerase
MTPEATTSGEVVSLELDRSKQVVVAGAGGFIGGHLVAELKRRGFDRIRAVDIKPPSRWYQQHDGVETVTADLREIQACRAAAAGTTYLFNLAADMGGMGFIETHKADCMVSVLITNLLTRRADHASSASSSARPRACTRWASRPTRT